MIDFNDPSTITQESAKEFLETVLEPRIQEAIKLEITSPIICAASLIAGFLEANRINCTLQGTPLPTPAQEIGFGFYLGIVAEREGWCLLPEE